MHSSSECRAFGYVSLLVQTMLERSTCLYSSGNVAGGADLSREALREAEAQSAAERGYARPASRERAW
jgi:hypothetical protein